MTQPDTLHTRLRAELARRLEVARAATPGPWTTRAGYPHIVYPPPNWDDGGTDGPDWCISTNLTERPQADAEYIALHDPADAIRRYEGELEVLERHAPCTDDHESGDGICSGGDCHTCAEFHPCPELKALAYRLGVNVE